MELILSFPRFDRSIIAPSLGLVGGTLREALGPNTKSPPGAACCARKQKLSKTHSLLKPSFFVFASVFLTAYSSCSWSELRDGYAMNLVTPTSIAQDVQASQSSKNS